MPTCSARTIHFFDSILQHFDYLQHKSIVLLSTLDSRSRSSFRQRSCWLENTAQDSQAFQSPALSFLHGFFVSFAVLSLTERRS
jgi:hypothetical protein